MARKVQTEISRITIGNKGQLVPHTMVRMTSKISARRGMAGVGGAGAAGESGAADGAGEGEPEDISARVARITVPRKGAKYGRTPGRARKKRALVAPLFYPATSRAM